MSKIFKLSVCLVSLMFFLFGLYRQLANGIKLQNFQINSITQKVSFVQDKEINLLKGGTIRFYLNADSNNLGTIELLFNNHNRLNKDELTFSMREVGGNYEYVGTVDTALMDSGQFFPFGFPIIPNSKGKLYVVEITSLNGTKHDSVSINRGVSYIKAKYFIRKGEILNISQSLPFFIAKTYELIGYLEILKVVTLLVLCTLPVIILSLINRYINLKVLLLRLSNIVFNPWLFVIIAIYSASHLYFVKYSQFWDSEWYWQLLLSGVSNVIEHKGSLYGLVELILTNFNFLGHPSMGYVLVLSIGQFFDLGNVVMVNATNILLGIVSIVSFYYLVKLIFPKERIGIVLMTGLFAFNPLFYATSISLNLDYSVLVFGLISTTLILYKKYKLFLVFSLFLIFSKETGMIVYCSICFGYFLLYKEYFLKNKYFIVTPVVIFFFYLYLNDWSLWNPNALSNAGNTMTFKLQNNEIFAFGYNSENIKVRLFQIFIMNFKWLLTPFILIGLVKYNSKNYMFFMLILIPFLFFNLIYTAMPFARYVVLSEFIILILFYSSINHLIKNKLVINTYIGLVLLLMLVQTFRSIDPSPILFYGRNFVGKNISSPVFGYRDGRVFNSEFYFIENLSIRLKEIGMQRNKDFILNYDAQYFFKSIDIVGTVEEIDKVDSSLKELIYVHVPWFGDRNKNLDVLSRLFSISQGEVIDSNGYSIEVFDLAR